MPLNRIVIRCKSPENFAAVEPLARSEVVCYRRIHLWFWKQASTCQSFRSQTLGETGTFGLSGRKDCQPVQMSDMLVTLNVMATKTLTIGFPLLNKSKDGYK